MSRSKNKIAVTTLLSALACSATTTSAAGTNERDIRSVESQASFSTRKSSESSIKSARSLEGAKSWFEKLPTGAKIAMFVSAPILAAEIYNEIAGAVSGKEWYSGKYSFVNLARGKGKDETKKPDGSDDPEANLGVNSSSKLGLGLNSDLNPNPDLALNININDGKDKKYTNLGDTAISGKKDNTGLGAAISVQEAEIKKRNLQKIDDALEKLALSKNLKQKGPLRQRILEVLMKFPKVKNLDGLIKNKKNSSSVEYNVKDFEDLAMLCENEREIQSIEITFESFVKVKIAIDEKKGYYIKVYGGDKVKFEVCDYQKDEENKTLIGYWIGIN